MLGGTSNDATIKVKRSVGRPRKHPVSTVLDKGTNGDVFESNIIISPNDSLNPTSTDANDELAFETPPSVSVKLSNCRLLLM